MSSTFTLDFLSNYISIRHPVDYEITPESQQQLWVAIGRACNKYKCWRVLAESSAPPKRNMTQVDAFRSATQAAKASSGLRLAIVLQGYNPDEITEFFINSAYNAGVRIEFFADREDAIKWLGIDGDQVA
jgi:hypothetical protein